ncbi:thiolase, N-terminal domain protein [Acinetobacter sp. WC-743]|nr:thiolase, N-terminal domain protein [Acinetobacter sp. WC-743]
MYGVETMPQTAENVAEQFNINRADQDQFALNSQQRTAAAQAQGFFKQEIVAVTIPQRKGDALWWIKMSTHERQPHCKPCKN